jgi:polyisoprenyl-phosphate glycosyltransferase
MASWVGFKQVALEYERKERFAGETKYPLKKMIKFALDGIFSFSVKPLKLVEYLGCTTILIAFILIIYTTLSPFLGFKTLALGWTLALILAALIGGIQLFSIGIVGEYVARIYDESKGRPLYIIEKEINLNAAPIIPVSTPRRKLHLDKNLRKPLLVIANELEMSSELNTYEGNGANKNS